MAQNNALSTIDNPAVMPSPSEWQLMRDMAENLLPTGFLPKAITTPEQVIAIMLKGRELNIPPMLALSNINIINGKPSCNPELMHSLVQRDHGTNAMWVESSTNEACTVAYIANASVKHYTFTIEDAERAGLPKKNPTWNQYPAALLRARCIGAVAKMAFPASIGGMYTPGELGEPVIVNDDGEIMSAPNPAPRPMPAREPIRGQVAEIVEDPELKKQKKALWDLANGTWGWGMETLDLVAMEKTGQHLTDLTTEQIKTLYMDLVGTSQEERDAILHRIMNPDDVQEAS